MVYHWSQVRSPSPLSDMQESAPVVAGQPIPITLPKVDGATPQAIYEALNAQRKELRNQLDRLQDQRQDIANDLRRDELTSPERDGLTNRLKETDARISSLEQQIAQSDLSVSQAAAVPGAVVPPPPPPPRSGPPEEVFIIPVVFTIFVLAPIAVAYARRIWKRGATVIAPVPKEVTERLEQMGQAVESIAVEVERIGEGQRFLTRVMSEQGKQLGAGAAQPIAVPQGQRVHEEMR